MSEVRVSRSWIKRLLEHGLSLVEIARFIEIPVEAVCAVLRAEPGDTFLVST